MEKVNQSSHRGFRWTAEDLKQMWVEIQTEVEIFAQEDFSSSATAPAHFFRIWKILERSGVGIDTEQGHSHSVGGTISATAGNTGVHFSTSISNIDENEEESMQNDERENPLRSPKDKQELDRINQDDDGKLDDANDDDSDEVDDTRTDDVEDSDYSPSQRRRSKRHMMTVSKARLRKALNPKKFVRRPLLRPKDPVEVQEKGKNPNFSASEVRVMLDVYEEHKDVLNCRQFRPGINVKKLRIWQAMASRLNKSAGIHFICSFSGGVGIA